MKVIVIGAPSFGDEARKIDEIARLLDKENDMIVIVGENEVKNEVALIEKIAHLEKPLLFKPRPIIENPSFFSEKRTNHERQPSRYRRK